ncbi:MAG: hypothetical protein JW741_19510 [Sedimentisphaerales bacterium]|nr:hypothetical protein [Sedimentisphaerales bacterium]
MGEPNRFDPKNAAKTAKKQAKAALKAEKARRKAEASGSVPVLTPAAELGTPNGAMTPAERSARAAERSARLTYYRVWIGIVAIIVSLIAAGLAWLQYSRSRPEPTAPPTESVRDWPD